MRRSTKVKQRLDSRRLGRKRLASGRGASLASIVPALIAFGILLAACGSAQVEQVADSQGDTSVSATSSTDPASTATASTDTASTDTASTLPQTTSPASTETADAITTAPADTVVSSTTTDAGDPTSQTTAAETTSTAAPTTSTTTAAPTTSTTTSEPVTAPEVQFGAEIFEIAGPTVDRLEHSWREGCPVGLSDLRLITLSHWDYQGSVSSGELVVHVDHAEDMVQVFSRLFDARFPIERMEIVDNFVGDDDLSMAANNTSAFNCREIASRPGTWSNHAFGAAVDINPLVNPYVSLSGDQVFPPEGAQYTNRNVRVTGGIYAGDVVTQAFAEIGWGWGGDWNSVKDWQHFSANGD